MFHLSSVLIKFTKCIGGMLFYFFNIEEEFDVQTLKV